MTDTLPKCKGVLAFVDCDNNVNRDTWKKSKKLYQDFKDKVVFYLVHNVQDASQRGLNIRQEGGIDHATEIQFLYRLDPSNKKKKVDPGSFDDLRRDFLAYWEKNYTIKIYILKEQTYSNNSIYKNQSE